MRVSVYRDSGNLEGAVIYSPLATTLTGLLSKGKKEIDKNSGLRQRELTINYLPNIRVGLLLLIEDDLGFRSFGKITATNHNLKSHTIDLTIMFKDGEHG
jgi:hypothetical protein